MYASRRKLVALVLIVSFAFVSESKAAATLTNLSGVYDTATNRLSVTFDLAPGLEGVDSWYFDFDAFPSPAPSVFDPSTKILYSTVAGAYIDQFYSQESVWIDFPMVVTTPITYTIVFQTADVSEVPITTDVDIYVNPNFGNNPSSLAETAFPNLPYPFVAGTIAIPEPSSLLLAALMLAVGGCSCRLMR